MIITLSKPINVRGETLSELDLNLDGLTGKDLLDAENSLRMAGKNTGAWDMSRAFLIRVAAKALNLPPELLETLPVKDFLNVVNQVLIFFADGDSAASTEESSAMSS